MPFQRLYSVRWGMSFARRVGGVNSPSERRCGAGEGPKRRALKVEDQCEEETTEWTRPSLPSSPTGLDSERGPGDGEAASLGHRLAAGRHKRHNSKNPTPYPSAQSVERDSSQLA